MWCESVRRSERRYQEPPVDTIRTEKNETGILGCGLFVVAYFHPATYTDHLHFPEVAGGFENSHKTWFVSRTTGAVAQKE